MGCISATNRKETHKLTTLWALVSDLSDPNAAGKLATKLSHLFSDYGWFR